MDCWREILFFHDGRHRFKASRKAELCGVDKEIPISVVKNKRDMTPKNAGATASSGLSRYIVILILLLLLASYSLVLMKNLCAVAGGADSSGYLNAARMISKGKLIEPVKPLELFLLGEEFSPVFRPLGYSWGVAGGTRVPHYPLGMPWHMAIFGLALGWKTGPFLVSPVAAVFALVLMTLLARQFRLPWPYAIAGAVILAAFPAWLFMAVQPMSDVLATFWVMAAVFFGIKARRKAAWAALSGAALGISILVRPSNALMIIPLMFALPGKPKAWLLFIAGSSPFGIYWLATNHALYGGYLTTGYRGMINDLAFGYFLTRFHHYIHWLVVTLTPLIPLAWLVIPAVRNVSCKDKLLLLSWFLSPFLFYCFYRPYEFWWYLRFLLPGVPALVLAALLLARTGQTFLEKKLLSRRTRLGRSIKPAAWTIVALLFFVVFRTEVKQTIRLRALAIDEEEAYYRETCLMVKDEWPPRSIVLSMQTSGALTYYTDFIPCRWDHLTQEMFVVLRQKAELQGYRFYAMLFPGEDQEFFKNAPGPWERIGHHGHISLWRLPPGQ